MWARLFMQASPRTRSPPTIQRKYRYPSKSKSNSKYRLQAVKEDATLCCRTRIKHRIVQFRSLSHRPLLSRQQLCRYSQGMRVTSSTAISQRLIAVRSRLIRNRVRLFLRHPRGRNLLFRIWAKPERTGSNTLSLLHKHKRHIHNFWLRRRPLRYKSSRRFTI